VDSTDDPQSLTFGVGTDLSAPTIPSELLISAPEQSEENVDRIKKLYRMHESQSRSLSPIILSILFILSDLLLLLVVV
jgi:hypothetical protein